MIDFQKAHFAKLRPVDNECFAGYVSDMLLDNEEIIQTYQSIRDGVIFTNARIIAVNVKGITGRKIDFTSLPYSKIQTFSVETAGVFDLDSELELWFSGLGKVKFEFVAECNVSEICKIISDFVL